MTVVVMCLQAELGGSAAAVSRHQISDRTKQQGLQQGGQQGGQLRVSSRRRGANGRGASERLDDSLRAASEQALLPLPHEEATTSAHPQADTKPMFRTTAVNAAATAPAAAPISRMQHWAGNSLDGRVPVATGTVWPCAHSQHD